MPVFISFLYECQFLLASLPSVDRSCAGSLSEPLEVLLSGSQLKMALDNA